MISLLAGALAESVPSSVLSAYAVSLRGAAVGESANVRSDNTALEELCRSDLSALEREDALALLHSLVPMAVLFCAQHQTKGFHGAEGGDVVGADDKSKETTHSLLMQQLLPMISRQWHQLQLSESDRGEALGALWSLVHKIDQDTELSASGVQFLALARLVHCFLPWLDDEAPNLSLFSSSHFELRQQQALEQLLLHGLCPQYSGSVQKQTLYVCKQLAKFSSLVPCATPCKFGWPTTGHVSWLLAWRAFIELYEVLAEPQLHLIEPHLFKLERYFFPSSEQSRSDSARIAERVGQVGPLLGLPWWACLLQRAFANTSVNVRKRIVEGVLHGAFLLCTPNLATIWREQREFFLHQLPSMLDNAFLYTHLNMHRVTSPFGEAVGAFYARALYFLLGPPDDGPDLPSAPVVLRTLLEVLCGMTNNLAILYLLAALSKYLPQMAMLDGQRPMQRFLRDDDLRRVQWLATDHSGFHNSRARQFLQAHLLRIVLTFSAPEASFAGLLASLEACCRDDTNFVLGSRGFEDARLFLLQRHPGQLEALIVKMGKDMFSCADGRAAFLGAACSYALACCLQLSRQPSPPLSPSRPETAISSSSFAACTDPLFKAIVLLCEASKTSNAIDESPTLGTCGSSLAKPSLWDDAVQVSAAFCMLNTQLARVTGGTVYLLQQIDWNERLFEWMAMLTRCLCLSYGPDDFVLASGRQDDAGGCSGDDTAATKRMRSRDTVLDARIIVSLQDVVCLLRAFSLLAQSVRFDRSSGSMSPPLVQWTDMILLRCSQWLERLHWDSRRTFSSVRLQLLKVAVAGTIAACIQVLCRFDDAQHDRQSSSSDDGSLSESLCAVRMHDGLLNRRVVIEQLLGLRIVNWVDGSASQARSQGAEDLTVSSVATELIANVWECLGHLAMAAPDFRSDCVDDGVLYTPAEIIDIGIALLRDGGARGQGVVSILRCIGRVIGEAVRARQAGALPIEPLLETSLWLLEHAETAAWSLEYGRAVADCLFQPALLAESQWCSTTESPLQAMVQRVLHGGIGEKRRGLVALWSQRLRAWWTGTEQGRRTLPWWSRTLLDLLAWGPIRSAPEEQLAVAASGQSIERANA